MCKSLLVPAVFIALISATLSAAQSDRILLAEAFPLEKLVELLPEHGEWRPFPTIDERQQWHALVPAALIQAHIEEGSENLGAEWPALPATLTLEFVRNGNRANFEQRSFRRREILAEMVLAEVLEGRSRFLDPIADAIWSICEESDWGVPAHLSMQKAGYGLPDISEPTVDLFTAETGALLAWTDYLLHNRLDTVSPLLRRRIAYELDRRIITPILEQTDFWWMGFGEEAVNNWNPWINSNYLAVVLLIEPEPARRAAAVHKSLLTLDRFIQSYHADGGCDEGPTYWGRAAASLFDCLDLLHNATDGGIDVFSDPLIRNMARFIANAHIDADFFINFADAAPQISHDPSLVYRFGKAVEDPQLTAFAAHLARQQNFGQGALAAQFGRLPRLLPALLNASELMQHPPAQPHLADVWLPDIQVMTARSKAGSAEGFFLAAKGGHNAENHNHNDVGSFIVYRNGLPLLIDIGVGTYTRQTFSPDRYKIWTMQSGYHNLPTINGVMQKEGQRFAARDVRYFVDTNGAELTLDIAGAYPDSAAVKTWKRRIRLLRGREVQLIERYELAQWREPFTVNLMTALSAAEIRPGVIELTGIPHAGTEQTLAAELLYPADLFSFKAERIAVDDGQLQKNWGDHVFRLVFRAKNNKLRGEYTFRLR